MPVGMLGAIRSMALAISAHPLALMLELSNSGLNSRLAKRMRREYLDGGVPGLVSGSEPGSASRRHRTHAASPCRRCRPRW